MKKILLNNALVVIFLALIASACTKEPAVELRLPGSRIVFGASTSWPNGPVTRSEYSGKDENGSLVSGSSQFERIDWVPGGDRIRILCDQAGADHITGNPNIPDNPTGYEHSADYTLTSANAVQQKSTSGLNPTLGNGLTWGTGTHKFFAMYPAPGMESNYAFTDKTVSSSNASIVSTGSGARITGVIPATQEVFKVGNEYKANMNYAYMYAATQAEASGSGSVTLSFLPLFTAFEFSLKRVEGDVITAKMTRVELSSSSTSLTGTFTADLALSGAGVASCGIAPTGTTGNTVSITLPDGGVTLGSDAVKFNILTLPVEQKDLTLTLYFEGGSKRVLPLKDNGEFISVDACKKVYISNLGVPNTTWVYTFDVTLSDNTTATTLGNDETDFGFKVTSFRIHSGEDPSSAVKHPVNWQITGYSIDGGATWLGSDEINTAGVMNTASSLFDKQGSGSKTNCVGKFYPNPKILAAEIASAKADARDLSLYDIYGNAHARETANCYVVTNPGWYKFPCVYGNAIKNGSTNASAYTGQTGSYIMSQFLRHDGNPITDPWIDGNGITPSSAGLLWTDSRNLVSDVSLESEGGHYYVYFYISPETIHEGNAVIAVRNGSNQTVWSWHIWAIDNTQSGKNIGTVNVLRYPGPTYTWAEIDPGFTVQGNNAYVLQDSDYPLSIMKVNLGFCNKHDARTVIIRYVQEESYEIQELTITQEGANLNNPYYQWGRKDPMYPSNGDAVNTNPGVNKQTIRDGNGTSVTSLSSAASGTVGKSIQNPAVFYTGYTGEDYNRYDWVSNSRYDNLWNSALGELTYRSWTIGGDPSAGYHVDSQTRDWAVTKTVYDPCPPGFKVPGSAVFSIFNTQGPGRFEKSTLSGESNGRYRHEKGLDYFNASNRSSYASDRGFYFYVTAIGSGETSFFPCVGFRRRQEGNINNTEYNYWTACPLDNNNHSYSGGLLFRGRDSSDDSLKESEPFGYAGRSFAMSIRPMADN